MESVSRMQSSATQRANGTYVAMRDDGSVEGGSQECEMRGLMRDANCGRNANHRLAKCESRTKVT
jgi:hypothetical protein